MKKTIFISIVVLITTLNGYSQNQNTKPLYTFCGKSADFTITLDEFKKCKKELTPIDKNMKINSFNVSILEYTANKKDSLFTDYTNTGNIFSKETNEAIDKKISDKKLIGLILIESVKITEGDKKLKGQPIVIKIK